jgi:hypothetical protein
LTEIRKSMARLRESITEQKILNKIARREQAEIDKSLKSLLGSDYVPYDPNEGKSEKGRLQTAWRKSLRRS